MGTYRNEIKRSIIFIIAGLIAFAIIGFVSGDWKFSLITFILCMFIVAPEWLFPIIFHFAEEKEPKVIEVGSGKKIKNLQKSLEEE